MEVISYLGSLVQFSPAAGRVAARGQIITNSEQMQAASGALWGRGGRMPKPLAAWAAQAGEGTKRRHNRVRAFVE